MAAETFIERHGLIRYRQALRRGLPCPRRCEICRSAAHVTYEFDHCHVHGWVRGVLCGPCNVQMYGVDAGKVPLVSPYVEHWRRCPDCLRIGVVSPLPPKRPRQSRPLACAGCEGNGVIWLASVRRMAACPLCRHSASPPTGTASVTESDKSDGKLPVGIVTHSDETLADATGQAKRATLSPHEVRRVSPGRWDTWDAVTPRVLPADGTGFPGHVG